jgi:sporulation protein YlmC with PRC-barrel domain
MGIDATGRYEGMLHRAKELHNYKLNALNGTIGSVKDLYFDDRFWVTRYLVADTGTWLTGRKVLISPYGLGNIDSTQHIINTALTRKQIEESPPLESDKPVSKQYENSYFGYFGWPGYWYFPYPWGSTRYVPRIAKEQRAAVSEDNQWDPDLRSYDEVRGYDVIANDGDIGHIEDFLIDDDTWAIRYLIINTHDWLPGKKVLLSPEWIDNVVWATKDISVPLERDTIKQAPEYTSGTEVTREYENKLHNHYQRKGYWIRESEA